MNEGVAEENSLEKKPLQTTTTTTSMVGQPAWKARTNDVEDKLSRAALYRRRDR